MRHNSISCDWCHMRITERAIVRGGHWLVAHFTYEGARDTYEFCSETCAQAWADHSSIHQISCEFSWDSPDGRENHRHICKHGLYNGRLGGNHLECWCECGAHTERPEDWLEQRLREHIAAAIDERVSNALSRLSHDLAGQLPN